MKYRLFVPLLFIAPIASADLGISQELKTICEAKGDVTMFTYEHRDKIPLEKALEVLKRDWNETWSKDGNIKHESFVDMQRIVRDAYRKDNEGNFLRSCCEEKVAEDETIAEMVSCVRNGY